MASRNNMDRIGATATDDTTPPLSQEEPRQTMHYVAPTELVDLPSGGKFYGEGHPLHGKDSIEIRHMTAKDEDILTNKSFIRKGIVLDRLLESIIIDPSISPRDLLIPDKSAVLVSARIDAYGEQYSAKIPCISCGSIADYEFDLEEAKRVNDFEEAANSSDDVSLTDKGTFLITLPKTKMTVEVKPLTGRDEATLTGTNATRIKNNLPELGITDQIKMFVVSAGSNEDRGFISGFVDNMPAADSLYLRTKYNTVMPSFELVEDWSCGDCRYEQVLEVPFTSEFFWPKQ